MNPEPHPVSSPSKAVDVLGAIAQAASDLQVPTGMRSAGIVDRLNGAYGAVAELIAFARWVAERHDEKSVEGQAARDALSTIGESQ